MGNIMPKAGIEATSLAFWASVLTITSPGLPDVTILPTHTFLFGSLPERSVHTTTLLMHNDQVCVNTVQWLGLYYQCTMVKSGTVVELVEH